MKHRHGSIEVITGSMFSGKTDELIRRLRRATIAKQKVQVFKPIIDNRYSVEKVTSHDGKLVREGGKADCLDARGLIQRDRRRVAAEIDIPDLP